MHRCSVQDARFIKSLSLPIYISIDGSFFYTQELSAKGRRSCSCTTCIVYVNLFKDRFFYVGFLFRKADAKVKTFKYIFQIFSEVFFSSFLFPVISLAKGRTKERLFYRPGFKKKCQPTLLTFLKAGAKVRTLFHIFQMFSEVFFHSAFSKGNFRKKQAPSRRNR